MLTKCCVFKVRRYTTASIKPILRHLKTSEAENETTDFTIEGNSLIKNMYIVMIWNWHVSKDRNQLG